MKILKEKPANSWQGLAGGCAEEKYLPAFNNSTKKPNAEKVNPDIQGFYRNAIQGAAIALHNKDAESMRACGSILFRAADAMKASRNE